MNLYLKAESSVNTYKLATIEIEFDTSASLSDVFASDEIDIATQAISAEIIDTYDVFVDNAIHTIEHFGFTVDDDRDSEKNNEDHWSHYIYFHHPEDKSQSTIYVEVKLKLTDHQFTKFDEKGNIVLDKSRETRHLRKGSEIDRANLEAKLRKTIVRIEPKKVVVDGESVLSLHQGLDMLEDVLRSLLKAANRT